MKTIMLTFDESKNRIYKSTNDGVFKFEADDTESQTRVSSLEDAKICTSKSGKWTVCYNTLNRFDFFDNDKEGTAWSIDFEIRGRYAGCTFLNDSLFLIPLQDKIHIIDAVKHSKHKMIQYGVEVSLDHETCGRGFIKNICVGNDFLYVLYHSYKPAKTCIDVLSTSQWSHVQHFELPQSSHACYNEMVFNPNGYLCLCNSEPHVPLLFYSIDPCTGNIGTLIKSIQMPRMSYSNFSGDYKYFTFQTIDLLSMRYALHLIREEDFTTITIEKSKYPVIPAFSVSSNYWLIPGEKDSLYDLAHNKKLTFE